jgi:hypothetical protein
MNSKNRKIIALQLPSYRGSSKARYLDINSIVAIDEPALERDIHGFYIFCEGIDKPLSVCGDVKSEVDKCFIGLMKEWETSVK